MEPQLHAPVRFEVDARGVAVATLARTDGPNLLSDAVCETLLDLLDRCERDASVRVFCLRASGKHFCAGADIKALGPEPAGTPAEHSPLIRLLRALDGLSLPTVALVHGACVGGGVALVACCDLALAETSAFFALTEVRLGLPPLALLPSLVAAMGARQVRRYALTAERFGGLEAQQAGLVHIACPAGGLDAAAAPMIDGLVLGAPQALAETKHAIAECVRAPASAEREVAWARRFHARLGAPEAQEGKAAFLARRPPRWPLPAVPGRGVDDPH